MQELPEGGIGAVAMYLTLAITEGLYLAAASVIDCRKRVIPVKFLLLGAVPAVLLMVMTFSADVPDMCAGAVAGAVFILISKLTREKLGMADAVLLSYLGAGLGFARFSGLALLAFCAAALVGGVLLVFRRISLKGSVPFVPFILMGYIMILIF